jgi:hypothetical protein
MYAILVCDQNLPEIIATVPECDFGFADYTSPLEVAQRSSFPWYVVAPYVARTGDVFRYAILPENILKRFREVNLAEAQTAWSYVAR